MIIDSHQHFWKYDAKEHSWITDDMATIRRDFLPEDFRPLIKEFSISGTVAVQADRSDKETSFLLSLANENDFIKAVVGWTDLRSEKLQSELSQWKEHKKLKGFRHIVQAESKGFLTDKKFIDGVKTLGRSGYTYDLLIYHHQLEEALRFVNEVRDVKIVVDHIAKPSIRTGEKTHWELNLAALATFDNVFCKISGLVTEARWNDWSYDQLQPYLDEVFECFGTDRVMYGSDWPVCLVAATYQQQLAVVDKYITHLTESERRKVMGENAKTFYNIR